MGFAREAILISAAVFGALTGTLAGHRNRNALLWGCLGFVFGLFALLVCALLPRRSASGVAQS
jgi:hypothetical protein